MTALPIPDCSAALGVSARTLRRWLAAGAPVAVHGGGGGRGHRTLVCPEAIAAWRSGDRSIIGKPPIADRSALTAFAHQVPELLADAAHLAFTLAEGPHKRDLARSLAASWYLNADTLLHALAEAGADVPRLDRIPGKVDRLRQGFG